MAQSEHALATPSVPLHPFYTLPPELMLDIVDLLPPESFISFAFANYPLLLAKGLAPALSAAHVSSLIRRTRIDRHFNLLPLPVELTLHVMSLLKPIDVMEFVLANYEELERQGIAPRLTAETVLQLSLIHI